MRITFERSGGFAGLVRSASLTSDDLSDTQRIELERLVEESSFFELPADLSGDRPVPDDFGYTITIERDGTSRTVTTTDTAAPPSLRGLIAWLTATTRRKGPA
jgi:hypothetical protein